MRCLRKKTGHGDEGLSLESPHQKIVHAKPAKNKHYTGRKKMQGICLHKVYQSWQDYQSFFPRSNRCVAISSINLASSESINFLYSSSFFSRSFSIIFLSFIEEISLARCSSSF